MKVRTPEVHVGATYRIDRHFTEDKGISTHPLSCFCDVDEERGSIVQCNSTGTRKTALFNLYLVYVSFCFQLVKSCYEIAVNS